MDDYDLGRVLTFSHDTMPAASLPLELQQEIFSYLDSRSFYAARKACQWWRLASFDSITLARQLQNLPIRPLVNPRQTEPQELQRLFNEAARKLLLGVRAFEGDAGEDKAVCGSKISLFARPRVAVVSRGSKTVTINGDQLALFDTAREPPKVLFQRPLNDMIEGARQIPWLQIAPAVSRALALSSNGSLLAVAQDRTIQIYDLSAGRDADLVSRTVASAAGHYIQGLDFEQNERVLRVQLSGKGVVLYLGTPTLSTQTLEPADLDYWRSSAGLKHTFLDSSLLQLSTAAAVKQYQARLGGFQLLRPFKRGFLFAAQKHGGNESSHYIYGHLRCSQPTESLPRTAELNSITELAKLESFLSVWDYIKGLSDPSMGSWDDMPSAHEHHPKFAISEDGGMLLLAEREKKHIRHVKRTQLFLYQLPALRRVEGMIEDARLREAVRWKRLARFLDGADETTQDYMGVEKRKHDVARLPLSSGTLEGEATEVHFESDGASAHRINVVTDETKRYWRLVET